MLLSALRLMLESHPWSRQSESVYARKPRVRITWRFRLVETATDAAIGRRRADFRGRYRYWRLPCPKPTVRPRCFDSRRRPSQICRDLGITGIMMTTSTSMSPSSKTRSSAKIVWLAISKQLDLYPELKDKPDAAVIKFGRNLHLDMIKEKILDPQSGHEKDINSGFQVSYDSRRPRTHKKFHRCWPINSSLSVASFVMTEKRRPLPSSRPKRNSYRGQIASLESKLADFKQQHINDLPESAQTNLSSKDRTEQDISEHR